MRGSPGVVLINLLTMWISVAALVIGVYVVESTLLVILSIAFLIYGGLAFVFDLRALWRRAHNKSELFAATLPMDNLFETED